MVLDEKAVVALNQARNSLSLYFHSCVHDTESVLPFPSKTQSSGSSEQMRFLPKLCRNTFSLIVFMGSGFGFYR